MSGGAHIPSAQPRGAGVAAALDQGSWERWEEEVAREALSRAWVGGLVSSEGRAARAIELARRWLDDPSALRRALALHLARAVGARGLCGAICEALEGSPALWRGVSNPLWEVEDRSDRSEAPPPGDGVSRFPPTRRAFCAPTLAESALSCVAALAPSAHPARQRASQWALAEAAALWDGGALEEAAPLALLAWENRDPRASLLPLAPYARALLSLRPELAEPLALRLALLSPHEAPALCAALAALPPSAPRHAFERALRKQLGRVGRVRLWVECRGLLG
jgi:hypothetical protein